MPPLLLNTSILKYNGADSFLTAGGEILQWSPPFQEFLSFKNCKCMLTFGVAEKVSTYYAPK